MNDHLKALERSSRRERNSVQSAQQTLLEFLGRLPARQKGGEDKRVAELKTRLKQLCDALRGQPVDEA